MSHRRLYKRLAAGSILFLTFAVHLSALANPNGGVVVRGSAVIAGQGTPNVTVTQTSPHAMIDWNYFGSAPGDTLQFIQPHAKSVALNRVTNGYNGDVQGTVTSNGRIVMMNTNASFFDDGHIMDAAGFAHSEGDAAKPVLNVDRAQERSMRAFKYAPVKYAGMSSYVMPYARNASVVIGEVGNTTSGTGSGVTLDFYGDGLISFELSKVTAGMLKTINGERINREKDQAVLSAEAARSVVNQAVKIRGAHMMQSVSKKNGKVVISAPKKNK